ncbi:MAG: hypothetical protein Q9200_002582 [Gallowayella weberi]
MLAAIGVAVSPQQQTQTEHTPPVLRGAKDVPRDPQTSWQIRTSGKASRSPKPRQMAPSKAPRPALSSLPLHLKLVKAISQFLLAQKNHLWITLGKELEDIQFFYQPCKLSFHELNELMELTPEDRAATKREEDKAAEFSQRYAIEVAKAKEMEARLK